MESRLRISYRGWKKQGDIKIIVGIDIDWKYRVRIIQEYWELVKEFMGRVGDETYGSKVVNKGSSDLFRDQG